MSRWRLASPRAAILVGGESRRMGRPKALLEAGGRTLLERTVSLVTGLHPVLLGAPSFGLPALAGLERVDRIGDRPALGGPLAGLLAAFDHAPRTAWLLLACDLPLLSNEAIEWLLAERRPDRVAVLPTIDGDRIEPLCALYEPEARPLLERLAAEPATADRSLQRLRGLPGIAAPQPPAPLRSAWTNVNSPEDWEAIASAVASTLHSRATSPTPRAPRGRGPRRR